MKTTGVTIFQVIRAHSKYVISEFYEGIAGQLGLCAGVKLVQRATLWHKYAWCNIGYKYLFVGHSIRRRLVEFTLQLP